MPINVGSTIPLAGVLDQRKRKKQAESRRSSLCAPEVAAVMERASSSSRGHECAIMVDCEPQ